MADEDNFIRQRAGGVDAVGWVGWVGWVGRALVPTASPADREG
jgi:hypothetical protein